VSAVVERRRAKLPNPRVLSDGHVIYWWLEVMMIIAFYLVYSAIRNIHGHGTSLPPHALDHANQIMSLERHLWLFHEHTMQKIALHSRPLIIGANYFYGSFHFIVTIGTGVFLFRKWSDDYPRFRNTLGIMTALALVGFTFYPLVPPRMFDGLNHPIPNLGFIDTLAKDPAFWSFNSGGMKNISNQFAAMPSVHCAWATWCAWALFPRVKHTWAKVLAVVYPFITLTVIVITANHYILDAVGGFLIFLIGWVLSGWFTRAGRGPKVAPAPA
jgi:hypothetical protein